MNDELRTLIDGHLDGCLSPEELLRLNALLKGSPELARQFAQAMLLHDRLRAEFAADVAVHEPQLERRVVRRKLLPARRWTATAVAAIAATLLVAVFLWHGGAVPSASAAVVALDRMIEAANQPVDRVYRIRVTDPGPAGNEPPVFAGTQGRKPGVDGARLSIRGSDKFVLIRYFGNGTQFVTGSDGTIGWAAPPKGPVHLSRDTRRFRRAVPGEHEEVPFLDLSAGFDELRRGYHLGLTAVDPSDATTQGWSRLDAVRRPDRRRGPEQVRIWFDSTGVAHRIELAGLPQDEGRPRGVALELIEQRDLGPDFFEHQAHHDADRPVDWE